MNYGGNGTGSYGQHPGMGQANMHHQQQMLNMHQHQQQQQRMMQLQQQQQAAMRGGAYTGMHTGMHSGSQMSIYGAVSLKKMEEMTKPWPVEWKVQINQEKSNEKRQKLLQQFQAKWEHTQRQQMPQAMMQGGMQNPAMMQGGMQGGMMYGQPGVQNPMMNPMMGQPTRGPPNAAQAAQMRMNAGVHGMVPTFLPQQPLVNQQPPSVSQISSQNTSVPSPSLANIPGQSPQVINPATPQNPASVQPGSIDTNPPSQQDPEYVRCLQELKKLAEPLRKIVERCTLDMTPLPKAHDRLFEVMEEKRHVPKDLLQKLIKNTNQILDSYSLIHPLNDLFKRSIEEKRRAREEAKGEKKVMLSAFGPVSHLFVKIPDEVKSAYDDENETRKRSSDLKQEDVSEVKKMHLDESIEVKKEVIEPNIIREVDCMFSKAGKKWELSEAAANELSNIPWMVDPDSVPPSYKSPDITVCINAQILCVPPLCVQIPGSYPEKNPVVQFDRSFPLGIPLTSQLATLFERQLALSTGRSITSIYESYKNACEELLRLKRLCHNQMAEKALVQKLVV